MKKEIYTRTEVRTLIAEAIKQARKRIQTSKQPEHSWWSGRNRAERSTG